jgi:hypothetical protein
MMKSHPMTPVDAAWYHIDGPVNPAVIPSILLTRKPLDFEKVKAVYRHRLRRFERFRQRVVERTGRTCRISKSTSNCITSRCPRPAARRR